VAACCCGAQGCLPFCCGLLCVACFSQNEDQCGARFCFLGQISCFGRQLCSTTERQRRLLEVALLLPGIPLAQQGRHQPRLTAATHSQPLQSVQLLLPGLAVLSLCQETLF